MKFYLSVFILGLSLLFKFSHEANASTKFKMQRCSLKKSESLTIGCSRQCNKFEKWALKRYARKLGYKINIINMYAHNSTPDLSAVDGILIPGGVDIDPKYYINEVPKDLQEKIKSLDHLVGYSEDGKVRDPFEYNLLKEYFSANDKKTKQTPILGICRGMQMLTVSQGIPLYIDIKTELGFSNRRYTLDKVRINKNESLIRTLQRRKSFRAVENHHQGLRLDYYLQNKKKWPQLEVTATSNRNRIAEVLEFKNRPVLGVQFHPEYSLFGRTRRTTFSWLLNRACHSKKITKVSKGNL